MIRQNLWIVLAMTLANVVAFELNAQDMSVVILASDTDYENAWNLTGNILKYEIEIERATVTDFERFSKRPHVIILGSPNTGGELESILSEALSDRDVDFLKDYGNRDLYYRKDVWEEGQEVLIFGVSDTAQFKDLISEFRPVWMAHLVRWFDLEIDMDQYEY
jgi:hypothetical protein